MTTPYKPKLIEVALPLDVINKESAREKSIGHGHPSALHRWWARRPLSAVRAVLWSSLIDDPSAHPDRFPTEEDQDRERQRLFGILEDLVVWENSNDPNVLKRARKELEISLSLSLSLSLMLKSWIRFVVEELFHWRLLDSVYRPLVAISIQ